MDRHQAGRNDAAAPDETRPSRRDFIRIGPAALAAAALAGREAAGQDLPRGSTDAPQRVASDPGPENRPITGVNPNSFVPSRTDHGEVRSFWHSFSLSHRWIEDGGWTRQVNVEDFPISSDIAGVNMRLEAGGVRELHWHMAGEWSIMLHGHARLTAIDDQGRSYVNDVAEGDLWYFPTGIPHSIQGLGPDGCEFLLVFDDGQFSEGNTTLVSDWVRHTPREVLAKNWGVPESALAHLAEIPPEGRYIFPAPLPGPIEDDRRTAAGDRPRSPVAYEYRLLATPPTRQTAAGEVRVVDSKNFPVSKTIAATHVVVRPGGLRELHWHPNADEWVYFLRGSARITLFVNGGKARTIDFAAADVGYIPRTLGHYIENIGETDLVFLEMFRSDHFIDLSLSDWLAHTPPALVLAHLPIDPATLAAIPRTNSAVVPARPPRGS